MIFHFRSAECVFKTCQHAQTFTHNRKEQSTLLPIITDNDIAEKRRILVARAKTIVKIAMQQTS